MSVARTLAALVPAVLVYGVLPVAATATVPDTVLLSAPSGIIAADQAMFTFRADAGSEESDPASFQCRIDSTAAAAWKECSSPATYTNLSDGPHRFEVRTKNGTGDGVGSFDPTPAVATFSVDGTPPQTTIDAAPTGIITTPEATVSFTADEPSSFQCRLNSTDAAAWEPCSAPATFGGLADGPKTIEVRAIDEVGNVDPSPALASFTVDTTAPTTTIDDAPADVIAVSEANFSFSADEQAEFECRLDSADGADWAACDSPVSYTDLSDGTHIFEVRGVDTVGNVEAHPTARTFTVDTVAPETTIEEAPNGVISVAGVSFRFSADEAAEFQCRLDSADEAAWESCTSPSLHLSLSDGPHSFEVRAVDTAGNVDPTPAGASFTIDTTPPDTKIDTAPSGKVAVAEASFSFGAEGAARFECRLDSSDEATWAPCSSPVSFTGLSEGSHSFQVRAVDAFGNVDPTPAAVTFFVDIPVNGQRIAVSPLAGEVLIKLPGSKQFQALTESETIPVGSVVDTTSGKVRLASVNATGEEQRASFFKGAFRVNQQLGYGLVTLKLTGALSQCGDESGSASVSARRSGRSLWGNGHGNFRTEASYGSATVRGTIWLTEDRCDGTFFRVRRGVVAVRDFPLSKTVSVPAGSSYLAHRPGS